MKRETGRNPAFAENFKSRWVKISTILSESVLDYLFILLIIKERGQPSGLLISRKGRKMKKDNFTLLELLIVVSIIAVLTALFLPGLQKVRVMAKGTVCTSNLKQISLGMGMYSDAYREYVVPGKLKITGASAAEWYYLLLGSSGQLSSIPAISPFGITKKILYCPAEEKKRGFPQYTGNMWVMGMHGNSNASYRRQFKYSGFKRPSGIRLIMDANRMDQFLITYAYDIRFRHGRGDFRPHSTTSLPMPWNGSANFIFADGHVGGLSLKTFDPGISTTLVRSQGLINVDGTGPNVSSMNFITVQ